EVCELPSTYHPCGLLEVGASRVILHQPTFISHLLIGLSPCTFLEDGRLLSAKVKVDAFCIVLVGIKTAFIISVSYLMRKNSSERLFILSFLQRLYFQMEIRIL